MLETHGQLTNWLYNADLLKAALLIIGHLQR